MDVTIIVGFWNIEARKISSLPKFQCDVEFVRWHSIAERLQVFKSNL